VAHVAEVRDEGADLVMAEHSRSRIVIEEETDTMSCILPADGKMKQGKRRIDQRLNVISSNDSPTLSCCFTFIRHWD
jgi:hypothetical protein